MGAPDESRTNPPCATRKRESAKTRLRQRPPRAILLPSARETALHRFASRKSFVRVKSGKFRNGRLVARVAYGIPSLLISITGNTRASLENQ